MKTGNKLFVALLFCLDSILGISQRPAQFIKLGDAAAEKSQWAEAYSYYQQGYLLDTSNFNSAAKYADAARKIKYYQLAEQLYLSNYRKDEGKLQPDELYWLATMQKCNGHYEDALNNFKKYVKKFRGKGSAQLIERADQDVKSAIWALKHSKVKTEVLFQPLPSGVNSADSEIAPFIWQDSTEKFVFASSRFNTQMLPWSSYILKGDSVEKFDIETSSLGAIANISGGVAKDFYFSVAHESNTAIQLGVEGKVYSLPEINSMGAINTMPCLYKIESTYYLYFVSDRPGGFGGMDIWFAACSNCNGSSYPPVFAQPVNAGKKINTVGDELTPFINDEGMFFSSDYWEGFGGQDIFYAKFTSGSNKWSQPENLGLGFNSSANDLYYSQFENDELNLAFLSSNRIGSMVTDSNATCCSDIYKIVLLDPTDKNIDADSTIVITTASHIDSLIAALPIQLYFHNDEPNPRTLDTTTALGYDDAYASYLKLIPKYVLENTSGITAQEKEDAESMVMEFFDLYVKNGMKELSQFSTRLLKELQKGNSYKIYVRGFASPRAQSDYNLNLTKRRTASLVNYLKRIDNGIFKPFIDNTSENGALVTFELLPFGEYQANKSVSDDLSDERQSIYSPAASLERKIEIERIEALPAIIKLPPLFLSEEYFDFGQIAKHGTVQHDFDIQNTTNEIIYIDSVIAECGCADPRLEKKVLLPFESTLLHIGFDPFGANGRREVKHVTIYARGLPPRVITIAAERSK